MKCLSVLLQYVGRSSLYDPILIQKLDTGNLLLVHENFLRFVDVRPNHEDKIVTESEESESARKFLCGASIHVQEPYCRN